MNVKAIRKLQGYYDIWRSALATGFKRNILRASSIVELNFISCHKQYNVSIVHYLNCPFSYHTLAMLEFSTSIYELILMTTPELPGKTPFCCICARYLIGKHHHLLRCSVLFLPIVFYSITCIFYLVSTSVSRSSHCLIFVTVPLYK